MGFFKDAGLWLVHRASNNFKDGFESTLTGESAKAIQRRREEREKKLAMDAEAEADLSRYVAAKTAEYRRIVERERGRGNRNHPEIWMEHGRLGEYRAICVFNATNKSGRMDIYYGGTGSNPRQNIDHGHIVLINGTVDHWLEPVDTKYVADVDLRSLSDREIRAIKQTRNRLY